MKQNQVIFAKFDSWTAHERSLLQDATVRHADHGPGMIESVGDAIQVAYWGIGRLRFRPGNGLQPGILELTVLPEHQEEFEKMVVPKRAAARRAREAAEREAKRLAAIRPREELAAPDGIARRRSERAELLDSLRIGLFGMAHTKAQNLAIRIEKAFNREDYPEVKAGLYALCEMAWPTDRSSQSNLPLLPPPIKRYCATGWMRAFEMFKAPWCAVKASGRWNDINENQEALNATEGLLERNDLGPKIRSAICNTRASALLNLNRRREAQALFGKAATLSGQRAHRSW